MLIELQPFVGTSLRTVEKLDYSWCFRFGESLSIVTESPWRFITPEGFIVAAEDDGQQFGLPKPVNAAECVMARLGTLVVQSFHIDEPTGDLLVHFQEKLYLQFLQLSVGYESWRAFTGLGEVICTGGGKIVCIPVARNR